MLKSAYLTPGEFELMEIVWSSGEASVRQVWEKVQPHRAIAYTTVMTVLCKLHRKGALSQRKQGKAYFYTPAIDRNQALESVVEGILNAYFGGRPEELQQFVHVRTSQLDGDRSPSSGSADAQNSSLDEILL